MNKPMMHDEMMKNSRYAISFHYRKLIAEIHWWLIKAKYRAKYRLKSIVFVDMDCDNDNRY